MWGDLGIVRGGGVGGPEYSKRWGCGGPGYSKRWGVNSIVPMNSAYTYVRACVYG